MSRVNGLWFDKPVLSLVEGLTKNGERPSVRRELVEGRKYDAFKQIWH
jgi:hypothetical protein